jgi:dGTPase
MGSTSTNCDISDIRQQLEAREEAWLDRRAARSAQSKGRAKEEASDPYRTEWQRDRDRIIHTKAFRRLKHKTQVFVSPEHDHYRTRLTHTLEVTQISRTVARALRLNEDLTEAIGMGHDLGHAPFGHVGEEALDEAYRRFDSHARFRHYEQSLRIVDELEKGGQGLNLTWEVRDGILHHSKGKSDLLVGQSLDKWLARGKPATLEGQIIRICDRVAYVNHDIDDAIRAGLIRTKELAAGVFASTRKQPCAAHHHDG